MPKGWKKGQSGNPNGRPKGCKDKFTKIREDATLVALEDGIDGLRELKAKYGLDYFKWVTSMYPKEIDANITGDITVKWEQ